MNYRWTTRDWVLGLVCGIVLAAMGVSVAGEQAKEKAKSGRPRGITPEERAKIEEALPAKAPATPAKPRKLLIFELNVNYGGHGSIRYASLALTLMGEKTGAFKTEVSRDPAVFQRDSLKQFDAVFLNNTVGNLFEDPELRRNLVEFVYAGGGLMGVHGTTAGFTIWPGAKETWPEFGIMLGARGASHRINTEHVIFKFDDPDHPLNRPFGGKFECRDEFFRVQDPYSRTKLRILSTIDTEKTDMNQGVFYGKVIRADNDYALAWIRNYGRGRVFYAGYGHNPYLFWDKTLLEFFLGATQFALGDLAAPTTPSARLTPAIRAQEKLGWRLGLAAAAAPQDTLFDSIDKAQKAGLLYLGASSSQNVSGEIAKKFADPLSAEELQQIRLKLDSAGVRLLTYRVAEMPADEAGCRRLFEFARKMGVEVVVAIRKPESLAAVEKLCDEFDIKLAIPAVPQEITKVFAGRGKRIGAYVNLVWLRPGGTSVEALKDRLITLDIERQTDSPEPVLAEIARLGLKPVMVGIQSAPVTAESVESLNQITLKLAK